MDKAWAAQQYLKKNRYHNKKDERVHKRQQVIYVNVIYVKKRQSLSQQERRTFT